VAAGEGNSSAIKEVREVHGLASIASRALFVIAVVAAGMAVLVKAASLVGRRLMFVGGYTPSGLFEWAAIALLFVIAIELRESKHGTAGGRGAG
jgi:hypothetical protein